MSSWKGLKKRTQDFEALGVRVLGVASDSQAQLSELRTGYELPFTLLSDPMLLARDVLDTPISTKKSYLGTLAIHPVIRHLPQRAFHQPALFIWRGPELIYQWRQIETLRNLFGANGRPSPAQILELTQQVMAGETPSPG